MSKAVTKAFTDEQGNRLLFPSLIMFEGRSKPSQSQVIGQAFTLGMMLKLDVDLGWFEFDDDSFPHVATEATHSNFLHGAATIYLFEGPEFEKVKAEQVDSDQDAS